ncbi:unnamed protein product [Didymodactylos carnosus]|nr:unnamed protein product [Didymodactylos carnosus]CAF4247948.1 unnamed protein product [Didymodactylos carnosus]
MEILMHYTDYTEDANRLWVDIDRGIRSKDPQRQFEAILKMPALFKKDSPTIISAALIKLATLFQEG